MKKILITLTACIFCSEILSAAPVILYTPNHHAVSAFTNTDELDQPEKDQLRTYYTNLYPNAVFISEATLNYNCHSYAWNMSEGGPTCWLNASPDLHWYWDDESYVETTDAYAEKVIYVMGDHSATLYVNTGMYLSKWSYGPLMLHRLNDCPYNTSFGYMYYAKYPKISGASMIGGSERLTFSVNCIPKNTTLVWNYPTSLLDVVTSANNTIGLKPKTTSTVGEALITANFMEAGVVKYSASKRIGIGGPAVSGISISVRRDATGQIAYPSGVGLRPNAYYTATITGAEEVDLLEWVGDSNITIDSYSGNQMRFHTRSIPTTQLSVYGTVQRYGIRRFLIGVTIPGGVD